jgi:hypothetical protein
MDLFTLSLEDLGLDEASPTGAALAEELTLLRERTDAIAIAGRLDRMQARRLVEEHAVPLDVARYPVMSFTEQASQTNLVPALESATAAQRSIVTRLIEGAAAAYKRILEWLQQFFKEIWHALKTHNLDTVADNLSGIEAETHHVEAEVTKAAGESTAANLQRVKAINDLMHQEIDTALKHLNMTGKRMLAHPEVSGALSYLSIAWNQVFTTYAESLRKQTADVQALQSWIESTSPSAEELQARAHETAQAFAPATHPVFSASPVQALSGPLGDHPTIINALHQLGKRLDALDDANAGEYDHLALLPQVFQMRQLTRLIKGEPGKHWETAAERLRKQSEETFKVLETADPNAAVKELSLHAREAAAALRQATYLDGNLYTGIIDILQLARRIAGIHLKAARALREVSRHGGDIQQARIDALDKMVANLEKYGGFKVPVE